MSYHPDGRHLASRIATAKALVIVGKGGVENLVAQDRRFENLIAQTAGASSPAELMAAAARPE
jgi:hypothetical protein